MSDFLAAKASAIAVSRAGAAPSIPEREEVLHTDLAEKRRFRMNKDKLLLVIDMQNDFVTGTLANEEAAKIIGGDCS